MNTPCPHCRVVFHDRPVYLQRGGREWHWQDADGWHAMNVQRCHSCNRDLVWLEKGRMHHDTSAATSDFMADSRTLLYPRHANTRAPCPMEVPKGLAEDYGEACAVLQDSAKAAAALGRRCLQHLLREHAGVKQSDLAKEIDEVLASGSLPSNLARAIDVIRNVGNFAAHPLKSTQTGMVLPVEPGEAEWVLDTLELLFDFYCVQPARAAAKLAELDAKLASVGKPPVKKP